MATPDSSPVHNMQHKKAELDPWRVIVSCLFKENSSYDIPQIIGKAGLRVNWALTDRQSYSARYMKEAYRPRIIEAYESLSSEDQLRVSYIVANELVQRGLGDQLDQSLQLVGWRIKSGGLAPADSGVRELFFPPGSQHDAHVVVRTILRMAKQSLTVIDPYLDDSIFVVLATLGNCLTTHLLTSKPPPDFVVEAKKFCQQHTHLQVEIRRSSRFHDRFIVNDDASCWHLGCSLKDAGDKAFMVSEIEDLNNRRALLEVLSATWSAAAPIYP